MALRLPSNRYSVGMSGSMPRALIRPGWVSRRGCRLAELNGLPCLQALGFRFLCPVNFVIRSTTEARSVGSRCDQRAGPIGPERRVRCALPHRPSQKRDTDCTTAQESGLRNPDQGFEGELAAKGSAGRWPSHQAEGGGVAPAAWFCISLTALLSAAAAARSPATGWRARARTPRSTGGSTAPGCWPPARWCRPASGWTSRSAAR